MGKKVDRLHQVQDSQLGGAPQAKDSNTQPLDADKMRLRSGIKTPSAEEPLKPAEGTPSKPPGPKRPTSTSISTSTSTPTSTPKSNMPQLSKPATPASAKSNSSPRKRKVDPEPETDQNAEIEDESEDELAELEGALSAGEEDDSELDVSDHDDESDAEHEEDEDDEEEEEEEDDDALHSDDVPDEEDENADGTTSKIPSLKPGQVPGLDPDDMGDGGDDLRNYRVETDANGNERYVYDEIDPVYDSDDTDTNEPANTIGNIDLKFYDSYPHIGYDINGKKIMRPAAGDALDALLDSIEVPKGWTGLTDPATGKPLNLSRDELELIKKIQMKELPDGYDPYPVRVLGYPMYSLRLHLLTVPRILSSGSPVTRRLCL